ncbi:hypothetical protein GF339_04510 [candidate division KSB3 bacterium]|uniref:SGNH hydrolase-type esterase domain-containing protein n=1 Tax=candidate division KSB3 bacterium TaxID=2044937 RepID=A0A9D5Q5E4_9BACT|nr:hypothetical protein [candidate division KSB3 bacterium]MBD3323821.1 hypothetical protein [candidate division KSB3 bacterium]
MKLYSVLAALLCCGMLLSLLGCSDTTSSKNPISPQTPDPTPTPQPTATPKPTDGPKTIAAVGDSLTYGVKSAMGGYPDMLETQLRNAGYRVVVYNRGIPGEQAHSTDYRFNLVIENADIVLLMIGTNDIVNPGRCVEPNNCNTALYIESMLKKALRAGVVPFVSTVPPANPESPYAWANAGIKSLNSQIYSIAAKLSVRVVDNYAAIQSYGTSIFADSLHFTDQGYNVIARQWYNTLVRSRVLGN